jgi:predicted small secreted protein
MTRTILTAALATLALTTSACHTVNGAGKDLKSAGSAVSDASGENKTK